MQDKFRATNIARDKDTGMVLLRVTPMSSRQTNQKRLLPHWKTIICMYLVKHHQHLNSQTR